MTKQLLAAGEEMMKKTIDKLKSDFSGFRTGRASASLLENIKVDSYGAIMPLKQVAAVNVPEARTIEVRPWDISQIVAIEKAIQKAEIGLTPVNDGKVIRLSVPSLTEERRKDLVKMIHKTAEEYRIVVRNERRQINDQIKKAEKDKKIAEDERKKAENDLQKLTDLYVKKIDEAVAQKEKEMMEV